MPKKISFLITDLRGGGAERITVNLANDLVERGYLVDMVLLSATGSFLEFLHPSVHIVDLKVKRMRGAILPLVRYLQNSKPDAMVAAMWPLTVVAVIARKFAFVTTQLVLAEHVTFSASRVESPLQKLVMRGTMRFFFPSAEAVVAVSNGAAKDLADYAGLSREKITRIYNPVIAPLVTHVDYHLDSRSAHWNTAEIKILTVGTLKEQKNHELLIRAFSILRERSNAHLLILGEGQLRANLETLIHQLGLDDYVSMPGFISDPTAYYKHADLFALSSDWEGLPTVLIEALAAGTPIVSTDCPSGPREILCDGKYGLLVPRGDAHALAKAMASSLTSRHEPDALMARAQDFTIDKAADQYLALLFPRASLGDYG